VTLAFGQLAINWQPELRGILIVIIAVAVLIGGVYMIIATNLGARLGFLVTLTALFGWLLLMGIVWSIYGIGLKGKDPTWDAVAGRTVLQDPHALYLAEVLKADPNLPQDISFAESADKVKRQFIEEGWEPLDESDTQFGQAASAAGTFLEETNTFAAGEFKAVNVFDIGGERYPKIGDFDLFAFFHEPHFAVVDVAPIQPTRTEPGRAPAAAAIDPTRQHQYVYMERNLGTRRQPAFVLVLGAGLIFFTLCWLLHRRERVLVANRSAPAVPAVVET
jgi:hypothetical protein